MIWLKLAAAGMVGAGSVCMGYWYFRQYKNRLEFVKELKWFLVLLRGEIGYGRASLSEACQRIAPDTAAELQTAIWKIEQETESGSTFAEVFRNGMLKAFQGTALTEEDRKDFFLWLGENVFADEQMQIISLNRSIDRLDATIERLEREYGQYRKMTLGLGTLGGCLLLVILW